MQHCIQLTMLMQTELDSAGQEAAKKHQLEMQVDSATKEVESLQGQLSDLNAVLSHHVAGTKLEALKEQHAKLSSANHTERQRVDAIYANRAAKQRQTKEVQTTADQLQKQLEQKVQGMSMQQQQDYYNLQVPSTSSPLTGCCAGCMAPELVCTATNFGIKQIPQVDLGKLRLAVVRLLQRVHYML